MEIGGLRPWLGEVSGPRSLDIGIPRKKMCRLRLKAQDDLGALRCLRVVPWMFQHMNCARVCFDFSLVSLGSGEVSYKQLQAIAMVWIGALQGGCEFQHLNCSPRTSKLLRTSKQGSTKVQTYVHTRIHEHIAINIYIYIYNYMHLYI